jgi:hypothetical protein
MAGRRRAKGKPTRKQRQAGYWSREITAAKTAPDPPAAQFAATARWFRAETSRLDPVLAADELNAASRELAGRADRIRRAS